MKSTWVENYYEAVEYYYFEPDKIRRMKDDPRLDTCEKVIARLRTIEVPLNHIIKQLFSLAPSSFRNALFERASGSEVRGEFAMEGRDFDRTFDLNSVTQPDFLFTSSEATVSVEMKISAKSSIIQVMKYAYLALAIERKESRELRNSLIFLGPKKFLDLGVKGCDGVEDLMLKLRTLTPDDKSALLYGLLRDKHGFLKCKKVDEFLNPTEIQDRLFEIASTMSISFLSYKEFATFLKNARPKSMDASEGAEVYRNLVDGIIGELAQRKLLHENGLACLRCPDCLEDVSSSSVGSTELPPRFEIEHTAMDCELVCS